MMLVMKVKWNKCHRTYLNGNFKLRALYLFYNKGHLVTLEFHFQVLSEPTSPNPQPCGSSPDHSLLRTTTPSLREIPTHAAWRPTPTFPSRPSGYADARVRSWSLFANSGLTYSRQEKMAAPVVSGLSLQVRERRSWKPAEEKPSWGDSYQTPKFHGSRPQLGSVAAVQGRGARRVGGDARLPGQPRFPLGMRAGRWAWGCACPTLASCEHSLEKQLVWRAQVKGDLSMLWWSHLAGVTSNAKEYL